MSCVIIHGPIGVGKTRACLDLEERAREDGINTKGVISPAVFVEGEQIGYDCLDLTSDEVFPLVRLRNLVGGPEWFFHGDLKYAFSIPGFERGNGILTNGSKSMDKAALVFIDEYGRLEKAGLGFHSGAIRVAEGLARGGVAVFACRTDILGDVEELVEGRASVVRKFEPGDVDIIWQHVRRLLTNDPHT